MVSQTVSSKIEMDSLATYKDVVPEVIHELTKQVAATIGTTAAVSVFGRKALNQAFVFCELEN